MFNLNEKEISIVVGRGGCVCYTKDKKYKYNYDETISEKASKKGVHPCMYLCCYYAAIGWREIGNPNAYECPHTANNAERESTEKKDQDLAEAMLLFI